MYSATLGILWSGCTNTFIPFFSVRVATGNCWDCACDAPPANPIAHNNSTAALRKQFVFITPPLRGIHPLRRSGLQNFSKISFSSLLHYFITSFLPLAPRTPSLARLSRLLV